MKIGTLLIIYLVLLLNTAASGQGVSDPGSAPAGAWLPVVGGTLRGPAGQGPATIGWPSAANGGNFSTNELMFSNDLHAQNVWTTHNASRTGFSAGTFRGDDKFEHLAIGFANTGSGYLGGGISFLEISSFPNIGSVLSNRKPPVEFKIARTGWIATPRAPGTPTFHTTTALVIQNALTGIEGRWQWPTLNQFTTFGMSLDPGASTFLTGCNMSGGSAVLTCSDAAFAEVDIGKNIKVDTADRARPLISTIISRQSPSQVTLADTSVGGAADSGASYGVAFATAHDRLLVGNGNAAITPVAALDNYGHSAVGNNRRQRAADCVGFVVCLNEQTNRQERIINAENFKADRLFNTSPSRVDFQDTDHGAVIPFTMYFDGTSAAKINADRRASKMTGYDILAADGGTQFDNIGAAGEVAFALPTAATVGLKYGFCVDAGQLVRIIAGSSATINVGGTKSAVAGSITSSQEGACVQLEAISPNKWVALSVTGTGGSTGAGGWTVN